VAAPRFSVESSAFKGGSAIPEKFACDGGNALPPLKVAGTPPGTAALALLVDDPDAPSGLFTHLLAWNLPATTESIDGALPPAAVTGTNDFGKSGWGGPCPPPGKPHHYRFHVYALKAPLALAPGAKRAAFDQALAGNTLGEALLMGTYARKR
jgi:Raf kinase inhibitor-like YbhB/YbcL family protein